MFVHIMIPQKNLPIGNVILMDISHLSNPFHRLFWFELFCHSLPFSHFLNQAVVHFLCLLVNVGKVLVQFSLNQHSGVGCFSMLFQVVLVSLSPYPDWLIIFDRECQARDIIIALQFVP